MTRRRSAESEAREDPIRQYLDEIGAYPLLTADDEVTLAKSIERGGKAERALEEQGDLSKGDRTKLEILARRGYESRQRFIRSNLRLVVSIAKRYSKSGLPLLDLIQEGNLGLIPRRREVRIPQGFQILHLRHLVDPSGHHQGNSRQGTHDPRPRCT